MVLCKGKLRRAPGCSIFNVERKQDRSEPCPASVCQQQRRGPPGRPGPPSLVSQRSLKYSVPKVTWVCGIDTPYKFLLVL